MKTLMLIFELLGTVAFAASGAAAAMQHGLDLFGVAVLGMTTAVGGGIIRDLILDIVPPTAFTQPIYALVAIAVALICFLKPVRPHIREDQKAMLFLDTLGLAVFTISGARLGGTIPGANGFLMVFVGVLSGIGGGILRDLFVGRKPVVFVKHFYACASLAGALVYVLLRLILSETVALMAGAVVVVLLRVMAARYRWELPR